MEQNTEQTALLPITRDHQMGRLGCWRIKEGIVRDVEPERICNYLQHFWVHFLEPHFSQEERFLFQDRKDGRVAAALKEHAELRSMVQTILDAEHPSLEQLADFIITLDSHIQFEERLLFPYLQLRLRTGPSHALEAFKGSISLMPPGDFNYEFWLA